MAFWSWSKTAASNASADSSINWAEGQSPSSVNDSARAMMARTAEYRDDIAGAIVTGGTSTAFTVASNQVFDTLAHLNGQLIAFVPNATNTNGIGADVTLNVDSLGAKPIRMQPSVALPNGTLLLGTPYICVYNNSDAVFYLRNMTNPYNIPLGAMLPYVGTLAPNSSFVLPIGQALSRTTYATLFALTGTTFGIGDGSTTFNVIDMRGNVPGGLDAGLGRFPSLTLGLQAGAASLALSMANLPASPAPVSATTGAYNPTVGGQAAAGIGSGTSPVIVTNSGGGSNQNVFISGQFAPITGFSSLAVGTNTANLGSGTAFNNTQPTIGVNYIHRVI